MCKIGKISGAFLFIVIKLQATRSSIGESYEKWIKETRLDIHAGPGAKIAGAQENPRGENCQEVEANRGGYAAKGLQSRTVA